MFGYQPRDRQIDGYTQVGPSLGADQPEITLDDAEQLRRMVALDFFNAIPPKIPELGEHSDKAFATRTFKPVLGDDEPGVPTVFSGAMLHHQGSDIWRMRVVLTRSARMPHNMGEKKIQTRFFLGAVASELVIATKTVKAVRAIGDPTAELVGNSSELRRVRRAYERNMTPEDCVFIHESLQRTIKRAQVMQR